MDYYYFFEYFLGWMLLYTIVQIILFAIVYFTVKKNKNDLYHILYNEKERKQSDELEKQRIKITEIYRSQLEIRQTKQALEQAIASEDIDKEKIQEILDRLNDDYTTANLSTVADLFRKQGNFEKALEYISKAIDLASDPTKTDSILTSQYYKIKIDILKDLGNYAEANLTIVSYEKLRKEETLKANVFNKYKITKIELNNVPFFGSFTWELTPGMNILLGKNGYGKSHFLGLLASLLYEHNESITKWIRQDNIDSSATLYMTNGKSAAKDDESVENNRNILNTKMTELLQLEMDGDLLATVDASSNVAQVNESKKENLKQQIKILSRAILLRGDLIIADNKGIDVNGKIGKVPILAIPDSRIIDKSKSTISRDYNGISDLFSEGAKNFIELTPFADSIVGFLQNLAKSFKGIDDFKQEPYLLIKAAIEELSGNKFEWVGMKEEEKGFQFFVSTEGSTENLPLQLVSQGTFSVLAIIGTIYSFLKRMYPESKNFKNEPGIIMIDEIDAHLHPSWHQKIIGLLRRTFPRVQFIITAHSPLIIAGAFKRESAVLRKTSDKNFSVEVIDRHLLGVPMGNILKYVFGLENMDENFMRFDSLSSLKPELETEQKKLEVEIKDESRMDIDELERKNFRLEYLRNTLFYIEEVQQIKESKTKTEGKIISRDN